MLKLPPTPIPKCVENWASHFGIGVELDLTEDFDPAQPGVASQFDDCHDHIEGSFVVLKDCPWSAALALVRIGGQAADGLITSVGEEPHRGLADRVAPVELIDQALVLEVGQRILDGLDRSAGEVQALDVLAIEHPAVFQGEQDVFSFGHGRCFL